MKCANGFACPDTLFVPTAVAFQAINHDDRVALFVVGEEARHEGTLGELGDALRGHSHQVTTNMGGSLKLVKLTRARAVLVVASMVPTRPSGRSRGWSVTSDACGGST